MPNDDDDDLYTPPLRGKVALMASRPLPCNDDGAGAGQSKVQTAREKLAVRAPELVDAMFALALDVDYETAEPTTIAALAAKREAVKLAATYALRKPAAERPEGEQSDGDKLMERLAAMLVKEEAAEDA